MTIAFVIGNGISRQGIALDSLRPWGKIYGCNALYREFIPDVLVATDRPIATQIQETGYAISNKFYTRRPIAGMGAHPLPKEYFGYSSGPNAVGLAAQSCHARIYMLGFDMGPIPGNGFNNMYVNTEFYKSSDALPTYTGNWVKQIAKITHDHPETEFIRVCGRTTARIQELDTLKNLQHLELRQFLDRINNQKDF
jgi:hypothetical protein